MADELTHGCRGVVDFVGPCLAVVSIYDPLPWASSNQARDCELIYPKCSLSHITTCWFETNNLPDTRQRM